MLARVFGNSADFWLNVHRSQIRTIAGHPHSAALHAGYAGPYRRP
jgi:plasmid maintenance system antidote protein VapI